MTRPSVDNRRDVSVDPELLTRTSWVDARVAYNQVKKGRAYGNTCALWLRWQLQRHLFHLGCSIQTHCFKVLFLGLMCLSLCCIGLKTVVVETDVEKLWVEAGGRLEKELAYTEKILGEGSGTTHEIIIQTPSSGNNVLNTDSLLRHLRALEVATSVTVDKFETTWKLRDLCYATNFPSFDDGNFFDQMLQQFIPCMIITPLDCFWEGSKLLGPQRSFPLSGYTNGVKWTNLNPVRLMKWLNSTGMEEADQVLAIINRAGISTGYQEKPCLDPYDELCPQTAPNYDSKESPDVAGLLTGGCTGFAAKYMHWEEDLIVGGVSRNRTGHLTSAEALQSLVVLMGERDLYNFYKDTNRVLSIEWTRNTAEEILHEWQRKFVSEVSRVMSEDEAGVRSSSSSSDSSSSTSSDYVLPFATATLLDLLEDFSQISLVKIILGYVLMIVYACVSLLRWSDPVQSQSGVGVVGVLLVALSVAAGLGVCSVIGINFNASTTQIVPFLALGLGVDDMFLIAHTFAENGMRPNIIYSEQTGECLKRVGVSVLLTSLSNTSAFFLAAIIPIPALRSFCLQVAVLVLFNLVTVVVVFPAVVSIDLVRRRENKVDVFCCFTGSSPSHVVDMAPRCGTPPPIYQPAPRRPHSVITQTDSDGTHPVTVLAPPDFHRYIPSNAVAPVSRLPTSSSPSATEPCLGVSHESLTCKDHCAHTHKDCCAWTLTRFASTVYSPAIEKPTSKVVIIVLFIVLTALGIAGTLRVEDGLDITDVVPRDTIEYRFLDAQSKFFGFYNFFAVTTDEFNYAEPQSQRLLYDYHAAFMSVDNIIKKEDGSLPDFWLPLLRDWLLSLQRAFDADKARGFIGDKDYFHNASMEGKLAAKLMVQTGDIDTPVDRTRLTDGRLVDESGIIYPPAFYVYVTAWSSNDALAYTASQADFHPYPRQWHHDAWEHEFTLIPKSLPFTFAQIPFYLHNMGDTKAVTETIKEVRAICDEFSGRGISNFPRGVPFTFWEQYVHLRLYLALALVCVLAAIFVVLTVVLLNPRAAFIVVLVLAIMVVQLFGMMGLLSIKLSAVPAVILIVSVGIGVEFTVHVTLGYLTAIGSSSKRMRVSLQHVFAPVVHGAMTTLLGVVMLAASNFDFIVRYFFVVLSVLVVIGLLNGLLLLPVLLSILGPSPEVVPVDKSDYLAPPTPEPSPPPPPPRPIPRMPATRRSHHSYPRVPSDISLSTITEENSQCSSSHDSHISVTVQPEVIVQTSHPGVPATVNFTMPKYTSNTKRSNVTPPRHSSPGTSSRPYTTVKAMTKVKVEVHAPLPGSVERETEYKRRKRKVVALPPSDTSEEYSDDDTDDLPPKT